MGTPTVLFSNNGTTSLASNLASGSTSMSVVSSSQFPTPTTPNYFYCTLIRTSDNAVEVVKVTDVSGTTWTVVRAQEGTTALDFTTGDKAELRLTAGGLADIQFGRLLGIQTFTTAGTFTYTPTRGTTSVIIEAVGGGGGSAGLMAATTDKVSMNCGGNSGDYAKGYFTSGFAGATVTVGGGGDAGTSSPTAGSPGGDTTVGSIIFCNGGQQSSVSGLATIFTSGSTKMAILPNGDRMSSIITGGNIAAINGEGGSMGLYISAAATRNSQGGTNPLGYAGGLPRGYGYGGNGSVRLNGSGTGPGQAGKNGAVIIWEYA